MFTVTYKAENGQKVVSTVDPVIVTVDAPDGLIIFTMGAGLLTLDLIATGEDAAILGTYTLNFEEVADMIRNGGENGDHDCIYCGDRLHLVNNGWVDFSGNRGCTIKKYHAPTKA